MKEALRKLDKPNEYAINPTTGHIHVNTNGHWPGEGYVHVIEYSAYEKVRADFMAYAEDNVKINLDLLTDLKKAKAEAELKTAWDAEADKKGEELFDSWQATIKQLVAAKKEIDSAAKVVKAAVDHAEMCEFHGNSLDALDEAIANYKAGK